MQQITWREALGYQQNVAIQPDMLTEEGYILPKVCRLINETRVVGAGEPRAIKFDSEYAQKQVRNLLRNLSEEQSLSLVVEALGIPKTNLANNEALYALLIKWQEIIKGKDPKSARWEKAIKLYQELEEVVGDVEF